MVIYRQYTGRNGHLQAVNRPEWSSTGGILVGMVMYRLYTDPNAHSQVVYWPEWSSTGDILAGMAIYRWYTSWNGHLQVVYWPEWSSTCDRLAGMVIYRRFTDRNGEQKIVVFLNQPKYVHFGYKFVYITEFRQVIDMSENIRHKRSGNWHSEIASLLNLTFFDKFDGIMS